jgi:hypothetical protein
VPPTTEQHRVEADASKRSADDPRDDPRHDPADEKDSDEADELR